MTALNFRTKADLVYAHLREQILEGNYVPGARVSISGVARELGVSDIPVREGIKRLESEGLLKFETHKGAVVTSLSAADIEELFAIRAELEALAMRRAASAMTRETLAELRALLDQMTAAERAKDGIEYGRLNRKFHLTIYEAQSFERLSSMIRNLWDATDWCRRTFVEDSGNVLASKTEHEEMYEALKSGDGPAAADALRKQKGRACGWLLEHVGEDDLGGQ
jgi:DNA-binding GntR family transcriptional regulator